MEKTKYEKNYEAREEIYQILKKELVGPVEDDEVLVDYMPIKSYSLGILYPQGSANQYVGEEQELLEEKDDDEAEEEESVKVENITRQSSFGISCNIKNGIEKIKVKVEYAKYQYELNENRKEQWSRLPKEWEQEIKIEDGLKVSVEEGLMLQVNVYRIFEDDTKTVTISLINRYYAEKEESQREICEKSFLQVRMELSSIADEVIFIEKKIKLDNCQDEEMKELNLLYRDRKNIAIGNGTAVMWEASKEGASKIWTEVLPKYVTNQMIPSKRKDSKCYYMDFLANSSQEEINNELKDIPEQYHQWLEEQRKDQTLTKEQKEVLEKNIAKAEIMRKRMEYTIEKLKTDKQAFQAFQYMNQAMLNQMIQKGKSTKEAAKWYPFQIAFILISIDGIIDKTNENREIVDLLWFPTGGGKTEAYLGILSFTIFLRRIKEVAEGRSGAGTTAIMRYTLRLLTMQQFERATTLICACELIRRKNEKTLGKAEISIGLWVGDMTEIYLNSAKEKINNFIENEALYKSNNPCMITRCPWCGAEIKPLQYDLTSTNRIGIQCKRCEINGNLPIYLVDEEIYKNKPTLLISTVDKYARIPWVSEVKELFGLDKEDILPPELIIQDELHLIAGPLGTISGAYETVIDEFCSSKGIRPKIIASTATIRNSEEQIKALYARNSSIFPTQIKDITDSFFAKEGNEEEKANRMYVGTISTNLSPVTLLIRVYAAIFYATRYLKEKGYPEEIVDSFWTEVGYFNSIRELGGAVVQIRNDVKERYGFLCKNKFKSLMTSENMQKYYFERNVEITSRNTGRNKIEEILQYLEKPYYEKGYDYVLATNMISVGIDIDRLNVMLVDGQPKLNSEYIQASSRVGRKTPSIVIDLYNATKSRDKSHYEQFITYHSNIYKYVEATSVTPFSNTARDKTLHAILISLVRHLMPNMNAENDAGKIKEKKEEIYQMAQKIVERTQIVDSEECENVKKQIDEIIKHWDEITDGTNLVYSRGKKDENPKKLLMNAEEKISSINGFPTLNSMRNVDTSSKIYIIE